MKIKTSGYVVLGIAILLSSSTPIAYVVGNTSSPVMLAFMVSLIGTAGSLAVMLAAGRQRHLLEHLRHKRGLWPFAAVGASFAAQTLIFGFTTHHISASLLAVIYRTWPLILIALAPLLLRERMTRFDALAVVVGFSGMAVAFLGIGGISLPLYAVPFALMVFAAAFIDAVTGVLQRSYKYEITSTLFLYNLFSLAVISALLPFSGAGLALGVGASAVYAALFLGIIQNVALTLVFTLSMRMVKVPVIANASLAVPFITVVLGAALLGEAIEPYYLIIALSVVAGLLVQRLAPRATGYVQSRRRSRGALPLYDVTSAFVNTRDARVYDMIKGNGRVLAFYRACASEDVLEAYLDAIREAPGAGGGCLIMTNKAAGGPARQSELEFIKDILGHGDNDLLVMGAGRPELVEESLWELSRRIDEAAQMSGGPPKVTS